MKPYNNDNNNKKRIIIIINTIYVKDEKSYTLISYTLKFNGIKIGENNTKRFAYHPSTLSFYYGIYIRYKLYL